MFYDPTIILMLPAMIIAVWAQSRVTGDFKKYSQKYTQSNISARSVCERMLYDNGVYGVEIRSIAGNLTDNYNPRTNVISLSEQVYGSSSIAAIAVAAHETGHALQKNLGYFPLALRNVLAPVLQVVSPLAFWFIVLGIVLGMTQMTQIALAIFLGIFIFQLVTLPVEFNASRRAIATLEGYGLSAEELHGAKRVLTSAALTYVAATLTALLQFLRFFMIANRRR